MASKIILSEQELQNIINLYSSGLSFAKVAKLTTYSSGFIKDTLKRANIKTRSLDLAKREFHPLDEDFFEVIDTEAKAYFLGLLFADGNISSSSNRISIKLQRKDRAILELFSQIIFGFIKIDDREDRGFENSTFAVSSKKMKQDLINLGCTINKSLTLQFPIQISDILLHHFMRGYFDGDGCLTKDGNDHRFGIVSTEQFCRIYGAILATKTGSVCYLTKDKKMVEHGNSISTILGTGGNLKIDAIMFFLYQDATIYLGRKYKKYLELRQYLNEKQENSNNRQIVSNALDIKIKELLDINCSAISIANQLNIDRNRVYRAIKNIIISQ
jgi:hypothetical protein